MSSWKIFGDINSYFATYTITDWHPIFTSQPYFEIIIESLKYCISEKGLRLHAFVIMLNHVHLIVSLRDTSSATINDIFRDHKRYTSKKITELLRLESKGLALTTFRNTAAKDGRKNNYKVWQDGFHPKAIYSEKFCLQKNHYIHQNPVRKGYVLKPEWWHYSSAAYYKGLAESPIQVEHISDY